MLEDIKDDIQKLLESVLLLEASFISSSIEIHDLIPKLEGNKLAFYKHEYKVFETSCSLWKVDWSMTTSNTINLIDRSGNFITIGVSK